ncbi:hypothetical protein [Methylovirgula sp. 4M-Z18]|uniref:hypothetical protein n=1 Tax=Methylovirgula sp. 4M-Z18 TaxID=2293567 RepID=UPI000E2F44DC|nr:hypothetical protein [Methylovirgula sp. 4M-Z18]RFB80404.1 hypothetical protein DYH55_02430 [Methylovirgula sp. 4M-Z18]
MAGLTAYAVALCASRAIKQATTWAETRVYTDPIDPVDTPAPVVSVLVGHGHSTIQAHDLNDATRGLKLRIEMFVPALTTINVPSTLTLDTSKSVSLVFAGLWRQVVSALQSPTNVWADLFRRFVLSFHAQDLESVLFENKVGDKISRIAARAIELTISTLDEPPFGAPPSDAWADLVAAMQADGPELASLGAVVAYLIEGQGPLADWEAAAAQIGLGPSEATMLGFGTVDGVATEPTLQQATIIGPDMTTVVTETTP